ncbi:MAG TPA: M1 family metallopeptidase [Pirellulaceae bacterium]|nr:M1 family metallopeptidase [Pirellulaceae bacterium]
MISRLFLSLLLVSACVSVWAQDGVRNGKYGQEDKFRQLEEILPTPNDYRTASGAPGRGYWQQRANYHINVELDDENQRIIGSETITYLNRSPDSLNYLWLQLDANIFARGSDAATTATRSSITRLSYNQLKTLLVRETFDGGVNITSVRDAADKPLKHTIVKTMMRIDLDKPLASGESVLFSIDWNFRINDNKVLSGRTGYEFFKEDGNYLYEMAQWFPRMVAYTDATGWQHKQFVGRGEFTLELGDYVVRLTVPNDHIVGATGVLQNPEEVLTDVQRERLKQAETAGKPVFIVNPQEATAAEKVKPTGKKTWIYRAENVRDFAFASSRKFIWDAQQHDVNGNRVMAMSLYPKEAEPLWSKYSTHAIIHTLNVYSRYTFDYPYPVAYSVNGPIGGMEYPMICFNGPRPEKDGTYSKRTKYGLISVIIHEVGHNYFPMIVNTDERQWTWMDEGLNTFLQYLSEQEWEENYPSRRGEPRDIVSYMRSTTQVPIMTNSESILQFGPNGYGKPATALNILRETILGRELFDFAFRQYARRWMFKRPMPADFFRTMEDASAIDLDWFFRGWFYTTDHTDIAIENVRLFEVDTRDPDVEKPLKKARGEKPDSLSKQRNEPLEKRDDLFPELKDFYSKFDATAVTGAERKSYQGLLKGLSEEEKKLLATKKNFYIVDFKNHGGLVMPIVLQIEFEDGTDSELRIPAEIWRRNNQQVSKLIITEKAIKGLILDPHLETADVDLDNNYFPPRIAKSRFQLFKAGKQKNEMQKAQAAEKAAEKAKASEKAQAAEKAKAAEKDKAAEKAKAVEKAKASEKAQAEKEKS